MRIQHNIPAMNSKRNLKHNTGSLKKNLEKLSSGYRINRSADDAAGLAISEQMRASIAILEQAENNVQDGISLIQTADGAMQEIHDMLNRLTALSAQAANGTLSDAEREAIQKEVDEILKDITRIKNDTEFNGIPLLQGDEGLTYVPPEYKGGLPAWVKVTSSGTMDDPNPYQPNLATARLDFSNGFDKASLLKDNDTGFYTTCCTCNRHYSVKFVDKPSSASSVDQSGNHYIYNVGIQDVTDAESLVDAIIAATGNNPQSHYTFFQKGNPGELVIYDHRTGVKPNTNSGYGLFAPGVAYDKSTITVGDIVLQIGESADENGRMQIDLPDVSLSLMGISGLSVTTASRAQAALPKIKGGISYLNGERGRMGAYQNRLEHTYKNLGVTIENLSHAESQIRDVDVAAEMMAYTKNNILIQSAQAMLAQANLVPQNVLTLMQ